MRNLFSDFARWTCSRGLKLELPGSQWASSLISRDAPASKKKFSNYLYSFLPVLDFLSNRPQNVRMGRYTSSTFILNAGTPQGCVLWPPFDSIFTHDYSPIHHTNIIKCVDLCVALASCCWDRWLAATVWHGLQRPKSAQLLVPDKSVSKVVASCIGESHSWTTGGLVKKQMGMLRFCRSATISVNAACWSSLSGGSVGCGQQITASFQLWRETPSKLNHLKQRRCWKNINRSLWLRFGSS